MPEKEPSPPHEAAQGLSAAGAQAGLRQFIEWRFVLAAALVCLAAGVVGAVFTWMLEGVEHAVFGFSTGTFAEAITKVPAHHRFIAVCVAGPLVAVAWFLLRRHGPGIPSVSGIYSGKRIPLGWMAADTTLQVVNVAFGGSIGREGAPRQDAALTATDSASWLRLGEWQRRVLVACGAGAGLSAIYNIPFGGMLFAVEIMIGLRVLWSARKLALAVVVWSFLISWGATIIARIAVPDAHAYQMEWGRVDLSLVLIAVLIGPLAGALGYGFGKLVEGASARAPKDRNILWMMPVCYLLLAGLAIPFPLILGNGHAMAEDIFSGEVPLLIVGLLVVAKPVATLLTVRAGATGGKLTPSMSTGAAVGMMLAAGFSLFLPVHAAMAAVLGAGAFLAGSMRAPLTAGVLAIELTGAAPAVWPLVVVAIGGTQLVDVGLAYLRRRKKGPDGPGLLE
ncbi:chloride channel protein [Ruficoccus amylovorans]|uniref:Chloride channel protein n=1 Tax=Ruficoccus amylovorans TaxID=1804625 RepID=A0A842HLN6_9BACT|nr:chloride channel protein [Ruficoccus amylovorans]MBC2596377.1 chloride channel protein [Ruficoccus amylovorans]